MPSKKIALIIEGDGEVTATPALIGRVLVHLGRYDVFTSAPPINAHGRGNLTRAEGLERFLEVAYRRPDCSAVLLLLDSEGDCPTTLASALTARIIKYGARYPTAVVIAHRMFEVWFVTSASILAGKKLVEGVTFSANLQSPEQPEESVRDPKAWISRQMPRLRPYKETEDQVALVRLIDFNIALDGSRSFRRLLHAVEELCTAIDTSRVIVTPSEH